MGLLRYSLLLATLWLPLLTAAQSPADAPMTQAVMKAYNRMIEENRSDYMAYFGRAGEYYNQDEYAKALEDVNMALRYAPEQESDLRFQAFCLRAAIYERTHRYAQALTDLEAALTIYPDSYQSIYNKANVEFDSGHYSAARTDYQRLLRMFPRSQEAMFGLARVAVKENDMKLADRYADEAVALQPLAGNSYLRRAAVRKMAGNAPGAVADYIVAVTSDSTTTIQALRQLVEISDTHYYNVKKGLSGAIKLKPRSATLYYVRGSIAAYHYHYAEAIDDFDRIINAGMDSYPGLNTSLAECFYALGKYDTALANADYAVSATTDNVKAYTLKADILTAMQQYDEALGCADMALAKSATDVAALLTKAKAYIGLQRYADASSTLAEAILADPESPYPFMLRGWICCEFLDMPEIGRQMYERILDMPYDPTDVKSLRGFALLFTGKTDEATAWINYLLNHEPDPDGLINYYGACFYAQTGNFDMAFKCMARSLENGYADYTRWANDNYARINVGPLRGDERFRRLLDRYQSIFDR